MLPTSRRSSTPDLFIELEGEGNREGDLYEVKLHELKDPSESELSQARSALRLDLCLDRCFRLTVL